MELSNIFDKVKMELYHRRYEVAFLAIIGGIGIGAYIAQGTEDYMRRREIAIEEIEEKKAEEECLKTLSELPQNRVKEYLEGLRLEPPLDMGYYCVGPRMGRSTK